MSGIRGRGVVKAVGALMVLGLATFITRAAGSPQSGTAFGTGLSDVGPGESFMVRHWTTQHGLPQNTVTCLEQTRDGYLWLGTRYGLVRYDGVRFAVFLAELNDAATEALDCRRLVADEDGTLWVLTRGGLFRHRGGRFERHTPAMPAGAGAGAEAGFRIETIAAGRGGGLWLGGPAGVARYREGRLGEVVGAGRGLRGDPVTEIREDQEGCLWVQFAYEALRPWQRYDPRTGEVRTLAEVVGGDWPRAEERRPYAWESVFEDRAGRLWIGAPEALVCCEGDRVTRYPADDFWKGRSVRGMAEDREGTLWIVTEGETALFRFDGRRIVPVVRVGDRALEPDVRAVRPDREGNVWVGSGSTGLYRIQHRQLLSRLRLTDTSRDEVYSVFPMADGGAWLGTPRGLLRVKAEGVRVFLQPGDPGPRCKPVLVDRTGQVWLGVLGAGLARLEEGVVRNAGVTSPEGSSTWGVRALFEDRDGGLWVGTDCGLLSIRGGVRRWLGLGDGLSARTVLGVIQAPDGTLWVGTEGGGVTLLQGEGRRVLRQSDGLLHNRAWPLAVEPDGAVWLGTPLGLNRVRGREIRSVTTGEGLHDNLVYSLIDDGRGWYWSHCNRGIWRMRKDQLNAVADGREAHVFCISYDETDGMESAEGNGDEQPAAARLANGELWFPTTRGVVIVDPARLRDSTVRPSAVIEGVVADGREVFGQAQAWSGPEAGAGAEGGRLLRIGPGRARVLELHYTAPSFFDSDRLRFRYRLAGHDEGWHEAGARRVAFYTGLPPGWYRFEVEAGNHHGYWSEAPATLGFLIAPRFHQTWLFRGLVGIGLAGLPVLLHHRRVRYLRQIAALKQRETLEAERRRIALDLHDDLGAGLAGIALQVELLRSLSRSGGGVEALLDRMTAAARGLVDQLREVVWALNPACDTLENFVTFVGGFTEDFLQPSPVRCRLEVPARVPRLSMSTEARHGLVLGVKEALANAVRHGHPREVRLSILLEGGELVVRVADDGVGFEVGSVVTQATAGGGARGGSGLGNLHRRLDSLGGRCEVASVPGQGTVVTFRLRLARVES